MNLQALLGLATDPEQHQRYSDDAEVLEAQLVRNLDRFSGQYKGYGDEDLVPHPLPADEALTAYEADLKRLDRRLQSRGSQNHD